MAETMTTANGATAVREGTAEDRTLVIERVFKAPPEKVFKAWTDPAILVKWWGPEGFTTPEQKMDVREGGAWRTVMVSAQGRSAHRLRRLSRDLAAEAAGDDLGLGAARRLARPRDRGRALLRAGPGGTQAEAGPARLRQTSSSAIPTAWAGTRASTTSSGCSARHSELRSRHSPGRRSSPTGSAPAKRPRAARRGRRPRPRDRRRRCDWIVTTARRVSAASPASARPAASSSGGRGSSRRRQRPPPLPSADRAPPARRPRRSPCRRTGRRGGCSGRRCRRSTRSRSSAPSGMTWASDTAL